jgi:large subunit ribosomal protein L13
MNMTPSIKERELSHEWFVVDASGHTLGRLAVQVARLLLGKHKPTYTPHMDTGDYVIIVNAEKVVVSGAKTLQKIYYRHTGYPGGIKERTFLQMLEKNPEMILKLAVKGMLPKNRLAHHILSTKFKVYSGENHPHTAQTPKVFNLV